MPRWFWSLALVARRYRFQGLAGGAVLIAFAIGAMRFWPEWGFLAASVAIWLFMVHLLTVLLIAKESLLAARAKLLSFAVFLPIASALLWEPGQAFGWVCYPFIGRGYLQWDQICIDLFAVIVGMGSLYDKHRWLYFRASHPFLGKPLSAIKKKYHRFGRLCETTLRECFAHRPTRIIWYIPRFALLLTVAIGLVLGPKNVYAFKSVFYSEISLDRPVLQPQFKAIAEAIRQVSSSPSEQAQMAEMATLSLVEYEFCTRLFASKTHIPSIRETWGLQKQNNWLYLRGDCKTQALFCAELLNELRIPWSVEASFFVRSHVWLVVDIGGEKFDLLNHFKEAPTLSPYGPDFTLRFWNKLQKWYWPLLAKSNVITEFPGWPNAVFSTLDSLPKEKREAFAHQLGCRDESTIVDWSTIESVDGRSPAETRGGAHGFPVVVRP